MKKKTHYWKQKGVSVFCIWGITDEEPKPGEEREMGFCGWGCFFFRGGWFGREGGVRPPLPISVLETKKAESVHEEIKFIFSKNISS